MSPQSATGQLAGDSTAEGLQEAGGLTLTFDDNRLLASVFGGHDQHLALIEDRLGVDITPRGNSLALRGSAVARDNARQVLEQLYERARLGFEITPGDVDGAIRLAGPVVSNDPAGDVIKTRRKAVTPRSPGQRAYIEAIRNNEMVFGIGPAGTGKTYLAVACAAVALAEQQVDRIVLSRPAVEAGERLGFLPGDMKEKVDPYLRPLYDALYDVLPAAMVTRGMTDGTIEIAPLAFMRGRTLSSSFVILDEAQNTTPQQMKMFLTRLGEGSRMVITGDPTQVDLPNGVSSGLAEATTLLQNVKGIGMVRFSGVDIVRHPLVAKIVDAYERKST